MPTHLRSQDFFEVVVIVHICGLLFPGMAIVPQRHPFVVAVTSDASEDRENKEEIITHSSIEASPTCSKQPTGVYSAFQTLFRSSLIASLCYLLMSDVQTAVYSPERRRSVRAAVAILIIQTH